MLLPPSPPSPRPLPTISKTFNHLQTQLDQFKTHEDQSEIHPNKLLCVKKFSQWCKKQIKTFSWIVKSKNCLNHFRGNFLWLFQRTVKITSRWFSSWKKKNKTFSTNFSFSPTCAISAERRFGCVGGGESKIVERASLAQNTSGNEENPL